MKTIKKIALSVALASLSIGANGNEEPKLSFSATEVTPGLYMLAGVGGFTGGNIGLSTGEDGVVMIDDSMPPMLDIMKKAIQSVTDKPVDFLINTHVHMDHMGNNENMGKSGTRIVAHENLRKHLLSKGVPTAEGMKPAPEKALPVITFSHSMNFHLNGKDAHIFHVANAHTNGDAVIHFINDNVIHTGDTLFNGMFPYIDIDNGGSVDGYINAQKQVLALSNEQTKIIPGHGPLASMADLKAALDMLIDCKGIILSLIQQGKDIEEIVKLNPLAKYHDKWNWGFITTEIMTRQIYKGLHSSGKQADRVPKQNTEHSHSSTHSH